MPARTPLEASLPEGTILGDDYRIVRLLGEGGMGAVYVAEQLSTGVLRAVKTMHRHFVEDAALRRRFEQEARVGARIESDFVVFVLGAGVDGVTRLPWIAMELLEGESLAAYTSRSGPLPPEEAAEILRPLCDALAAAHRIGVVHRDLKPENVFLAKARRPGERFTLKVLDFGIAKLVAEAQTSATGAIGTPQWMAPEQTSAGATIAPGTDVWALGLIAFTLLTGKRYWRASNAADVTLTALIREIAIDPLESARTRAERVGATAMPPDGFDAWFARCVERDLSRRFVDAEEAWAALDSVLGGVPHAPAAAPLTASPRPAPAEMEPTRTLQGPFAFPEAPVPPEPTTAAPAGIAAFQGRHLPDSERVAALRDGTPAATASPAPAARVVPKIGAVLGLLVVASLCGVICVRRREPVAPAASAPATHSSIAPVGGSASSPSASATYAKDEALARKMVRFEGATFLVGSTFGEANERPPTAVAVAAFFLDRDLVTAGSYARCVTAGVCTKTVDGEACNVGDPSHATHPANCVTMQQAATYCAWLGRRLPTEIEYEWAAAGKESRLFPWGFSPMDDTRSCFGHCKEGRRTCEVGAFPAGATPEGVLDLAGNVWEWTSSPACPYGNPECGSALRITRGGGYCGSDPKLLRTHTREPREPTDGTSTVGFRCARTM